MSALNYREQFGELIEKGLKVQTIRAKRKRPIKAGETLYHYTGMRTKNCRRRLVSKCLGVRDIWINGGGTIYLDGSKLTIKERKNFAEADGFVDCDAFLAFFSLTHGLPFYGDVILWNFPGK